MPKQVAARAIAEQEKVSAADEVAGNLRATGEGVALKDYAWTSADGLRAYSSHRQPPLLAVAQHVLGRLRDLGAQAHALTTVCGSR